MGADAAGDEERGGAPAGGGEGCGGGGGVGGGGGGGVAAVADIGQDLGPGGRGDVVDGVGPCDIYADMIPFTFSRRSWAGAAYE